MQAVLAPEIFPGTSRPAPAARSRRGRLANLAGGMAEETVARVLTARGYEFLARRWRGKAGEIDLIFRLADCHVFVEVKQGQSHELAAARLSASQQGRICRAAEEYCGKLSLGRMTEMRFDVALVDALGRVEILENAFGDCFA
jgi:putative endonuclease